MDQPSSLFHIEGSFAVDLAAGELRITGPGGRLYFGGRKLGGLAVQSVGRVAGGIEVAFTIPSSKFLLLDPLVAPLDQVYGAKPQNLSRIVKASPNLRANRIHLGHTPAGTVIDYRRFGQDSNFGASLSFGPEVSIHRDNRGYRLSAPGSIRGSLTVATRPSPLATRNLELSDMPAADDKTTGQLAAIDAAIAYLDAAGRPQATLSFPGGWLLAAEAGEGEVSPRSLAWLLGRAIAAIPQTPSRQPQAADDGDLNALAAAADRSAAGVRSLARSAADRYLYLHHFAGRLLHLADRVDASLLQESDLQVLASLRQRQPHQPPLDTADLPAVLQPARFAGHHDGMGQGSTLSLDELTLWSLFARRRIIRTYLNQ